MNNVLQNCRHPITNRRNSPQAYNLENDLEITNPQRDCKKAAIFEKHKISLTLIYQLSEKIMSRDRPFNSIILILFYSYYYLSWDEPNVTKYVHILTSKYKRILQRIYIHIFIKITMYYIYYDTLNALTLI